MFHHIENMLLDYYYKKVNNSRNGLYQDSLHNYFDIIYLLEIEYDYAPVTNTDYVIRELWKNIQTNASIINTLP